MKSILLFIPLLIFFSCSVEPVPIQYGNDACSYCKMNIVDPQFAAEIVTHKGKAHKYDAIECMVKDLNQRAEGDIALFLVGDFNNPGELVNGKGCTFVICPEIKSPMGENLCAFKNENEIPSNLEPKEILNWEALMKKF